MRSPSTIHQNDVEYLVHDRIGDLYLTACETHRARRDGGDGGGILVRTRVSLGRRLVAIGHTVSGQGA